MRNNLSTCTLCISSRFVLHVLPLFFSVLSAFFPISFRLLDLDVGAPAGAPVVLPPRVQGRRGPVHRPLHVTKVGSAVLAGPVAPPPVLPVHVHFVVEAVVDLERTVRRNPRQQPPCVTDLPIHTYGDLGPAGLVDPVHVFTKLGAVAVPVSVVLRHKQQRVDHFVEECLWDRRTQKARGGS